jgi:hypothetical protein
MKFEVNISCRQGSKKTIYHTTVIVDNDLIDLNDKEEIDYIKRSIFSKFSRHFGFEKLVVVNKT